MTQKLEEITNIMFQFGLEIFSKEWNSGDFVNYYGLLGHDVDIRADDELVRVTVWAEDVWDPIVVVECEKFSEKDAKKIFSKVYEYEIKRG